MEEMPVKKNQELEVTVVDLSYLGMGVAKVDGYPIFVENALPQEKILVRIVKVGKKFGFGKMLSIIQKSPYRQEVENEDLLRTGIAPLSHLKYEQQLVFKQEQVRNVLKKTAKMPEIQVEKTIGMQQPFGYRNKAQIPIRKIDGILQTGFYRKNSHELIPIDHFFIQDPAIDAAIIVIREILQQFEVKAYNEKNNSGFLRHIVIRRGYHTHEMMVVLVTRKEHFFQGEKIAQAIQEKLPEVVSIIQNINPKQTNVILGEQEKVLLGRSYVYDQLLGKTYRISAKSFYQVNTPQAEVLYQKAFELADLKKSDVVIDAYSGIGTIGLSLANQVAHVYGMETIKQAVIDAQENAKLNGIKNAEYVTGKAEDIMPRWKEDGIHPNVIFVDPPRKGLDQSFIETACQMKPEKFIYISCNPATMARDLKVFAEQEYFTDSIQPVDLFPQTHHVETIVLLEKKSS
ncbi:23S rRNA (uracil(1939)-C(5))-methyltransferase RlmD [Tetragenococcus halophilus]|uniref:RNA methyltransferase n=1 Tax=Tetragenococcus halophilus (strain DSM 20338 / JCM 20259 / NCIMB 9735 / NBRC 12172) TaxID=945021 RepID=A0AAN1VR73_TETHN|nr:23S rRNA (uracil(1939)-C(5))-methyltransferase RlmD [Tetragenococcus halophilus]QXN87835.1 23S rRNA (uracil(1939)-C(5))-methyltransferase RlmD [Tetragenococcus halophilus]BAK94789.1 putative RNA methyltransferase [Tetragenococcus halophilus NBRC 12172]GBD70104.1 putative RNA methyltransferase [Tetragenococcus halophilus subsp. halophilus]GBD79324.1 putative RNA methyltransferase [Tetragenococcus halophilus subsp. halophilus]GBD82072.1 putative RNA methyltransferase [Tetragenococcus halophil